VSDELVGRAADAVRARLTRPVEVAVVLGTGLGGLSGEIAVEAEPHTMPGLVEAKVQDTPLPTM
jgi:purine nucleoside phosphorylase